MHALLAASPEKVSSPEFTITIAGPIGELSPNAFSPASRATCECCITRDDGLRAAGLMDLVEARAARLRCVM